jgi:hypothetical protein
MGRAKKFVLVKKPDRFLKPVRFIRFIPDNEIKKTYTATALA